MERCLTCDKEGQHRRLTEGLCATCSKTKAKTVINAPTSNFLTVGALNQLPRKQEIGPGDCIEMIGKKRQRELLEDELFYFPHGHRNEEGPNESEQSKHELPQKRNKTSEAQSFSTSPTQMVCNKDASGVPPNNVSMGIADQDARRGALKHQSVVISGEKVYYYHTEDSVL